MAEAVFHALVEQAGLGKLIEADSAGTGPWYEGNGADPRTVDALTAAGYRQAHTARRFRPEWFRRLDLVVALDSGHLRELRALAPTPDDAAKVALLRSYDPAGPDDLDVPDPFFGDADDFAQCLTMIEAACDGLLNTVRGALGDSAVTTEGAAVAPEEIA